MQFLPAEQRPRQKEHHSKLTKTRATWPLRCKLTADSEGKTNQPCTHSMEEDNSKHRQHNESWTELWAVLDSNHTFITGRYCKGAAIDEVRICSLTKKRCRYTVIRPHCWTAISSNINTVELLLKAGTRGKIQKQVTKLQKVALCIETGTLNTRLTLRSYVVGLWCNKCNIKIQFCT